MRNYILLFEELPFYFDTEKHISKRHCKELNAVLAVCAPCEHSLFRNLCSGKAAQYQIYK